MKYLSILFFLLTYLTLNGQEPREVLKNLRAPMDIPLYLAGNFGELRTDHFHTGLDIKTQGKTGHPVLACEEGHVSRIKIQEWGYGKAIYLDHPNGYTTVYAHLKEFSPKIEAFIRKVQYEQQTYTLDIHPGSTQLPVKRGEQIALSGNSGSSGGPHLHFEVRETRSEKPVNPLQYMDLNIRDDIPPVMEGVRIYPMNDETFIGQQNSIRGYYLSGRGEQYRLRDQHTIPIHGTVGFAIRTTDKLNGYPNECGVHTLQLFVDDTLVHMMRMDELNFHTNRYINAHTDYLMFHKYNKHYHRCFLLENNALDIYPVSPDQGWVSFNKDTVHRIRIVATDVHGNVSRLAFRVKGEAEAQAAGQATLQPSFEKVFRADQTNSFRNKDLELYLPPGALYQDLEFRYEKTRPTANTFAPFHHLHDPYTPVHTYYPLKLRVGKVETSLRDKLLIVRKKGGHYTAVGGKYKNGWMEDRVRSFGTFTVKADTTPPEIDALNLWEGRDIGPGDVLRFRVRDDLSGVKNYNAYLNGEWVLVSSDPKNALMECAFDDLRSIPSPKPKATFELVVKDERGNTKRYSTTLRIP